MQLYVPSARVLLGANRLPTASGRGSGLVLVQVSIKACDLAQMHAARGAAAGVEKDTFDIVYAPLDWRSRTADGT